jgi:ABC-type transport system involved in multi-copper enzyme maturation permease subunit
MSMKWLLWKDYRQNRPIVVMALFFLLIPHLIAFGVACWATFSKCFDPWLWMHCFGSSSLCSIFAIQLLVAMIGGNAFAGERIDRSAEFLASLPITREKIVVSKVLFALTLIATMWLVNAPGLIFMATGDDLGSRRDAIPMMRFVLGPAITGMGFFCIAWLFSSFLASTTFAVAGGLVGTYLLASVSALTIYLLGFEVEIYILYLYLALCLVIAPLCFALGTWHYLRRVEP